MLVLTEFSTLSTRVLVKKADGMRMSAQLSFYSNAQMTIHRAVLGMTALKKENGTRVPCMYFLCFSNPGVKLLVKASEAF